MPSHDPAPDELRIRHHYFVDESGDGVLFNRKGTPLFLEPSNPQHFILGMVDLRDGPLLRHELEDLRKAIMSDRYYAGVPSVQPDAKKTALFFHAKDDIPEVRQEVFRILLRHDFTFFAVVKSLKSVFEYVKSRNEKNELYRYKPNELYDLTVRMLFKNRLHLGDESHITFAKRGKSDRTAALQTNLEQARLAFLGNNPGANSGTRIDIRMASPQESAGLQCIDYCLWALQRIFERHEDRYIRYIWEKVGVIHDVDDKSIKPYGNYLTKSQRIDLYYMQSRQI